jgi:hypothetical protein
LFEFENPEDVNGHKFPKYSYVRGTATVPLLKGRQRTEVTAVPGHLADDTNTSFHFRNTCSFDGPIKTKRKRVGRLGQRVEIMQCDLENAEVDIKGKGYRVGDVRVAETIGYMSADTFAGNKRLNTRLERSKTIAFKSYCCCAESASQIYVAPKI